MPPLIKTKLLVPHLHPDRIRRPRITAFLNQAVDYPLTLVSSLAGSGKTTALVEWIEQLSIAAAWFSIDEADNDFNRFLNYLIAAFQSAAPGTGKAVLEAVRMPEALSIENLMALLVNDLAEEKNDLVLVLDDYHLIQSTTVYQAIQFLLEHLPTQVHLVISTRADPNLPLARLRARNRILELRIDQLRFTAGETAEYLNQVAQLDLPESDLNLLDARTEGWAASLQLAALSLKGHADSKLFLQTFSGSNRYILDYLVEEVLSRQTEDIQSFLLQTCILDRLCGGLCEAVTGKEDGQKTLEYLDRNNLFLVPLDEERHWFRYHHLFADLLRVRVTRTAYGQAQQSLHARASGWYEQNGLGEEAIHHALAAEDFQRAAWLIECHAESAWIHGQYASILAWTQALPQELVHHRPWLCIWNAWALTQSGTLPEARIWIEAAEKAAPHQGVEVGTLQYELAILRALFAGLAQDYQRAVDLARPILENPLPQGSKLGLVARCNISHGLSSMYFVFGEFDKVEQTCLETMHLSREIGFTLRYLHAVNKLVYVYMTTGQLHRANRLLQETLALVQEQGVAHYFATGILYTRLIDLYYEWNRIAEARNLMENHLKPEALAAVPYLLVDCCNLEVRDLLLKRNFIEAQQVLDKIGILAQHSYIWPGLTWQTALLQVRLWMRTNDFALAETWATDHLPSAVELPDPLPFTHEAGTLARVRILLGRGGYLEALGILDRMVGPAKSGGRKGSLVKIHLFQALALQQAGEGAQAVAALEMAFSLAEPEGYIRTFLDEGSAIAELLMRIVQSPRSPHLKYALRLLEAFQAEQTESMRAPALARSPIGLPVPTAQQLIEPLSRRELEVLRCMADGLSNSETARRLVIEASTVKRHVHSIFAKLGVDNRVQAINKAKDAGLL